jgi:hypothetical protein
MSIRPMSNAIRNHCQQVFVRIKRSLCVAGTSGAASLNKALS